jgi:hypothetical protein
MRCFAEKVNIAPLFLQFLIVDADIIFERPRTKDFAIWQLFRFLLQGCSQLDSI